MCPWAWKKLPLQCIHFNFRFSACRFNTKYTDYIRLTLLIVLLPAAHYSVYSHVICCSRPLFLWYLFLNITDKQCWGCCVYQFNRIFLLGHRLVKPWRTPIFGCPFHCTILLQWTQSREPTLPGPYKVPNHWHKRPSYRDEGTGGVLQVTGCRGWYLWTCLGYSDHVGKCDVIDTHWHKSV